METNHLIWDANDITGSDVKCNSGLKRIKRGIKFWETLGVKEIQAEITRNDKYGRVTNNTTERREARYSFPCRKSTKMMPESMLGCSFDVTW